MKESLPRVFMHLLGSPSCRVVRCVGLSRAWRWTRQGQPGSELFALDRGRKTRLATYETQRKEQEEDVCF